MCSCPTLVRVMEENGSAEFSVSFIMRTSVVKSNFGNNGKESKNSNSGYEINTEQLFAQKVNEKVTC
jgi:hypothetical protein